MWADLAPSGGRRHRRLPAVRLDREDAELREWFAGEAEPPRPRPRRPTATATSGPGGATPTRRAAASSPARTWTRCPTAARSTARSASSPPSPPSTRCARDGFSPAGRSPSPASATRRAPGSASPASGSRLLTGALTADRARGLSDADGVTLAEAHGARPGTTRRALGPDDETLRRIGAFVELHVEQGRGAGRPGRPVGVGQRDLAARPLAVRPRRRGQPRRHHPAGGPPRPDARPSPPPCWPPARRPSWHGARGHRRQGRGRAERRQRDPVAGHGLARRPRRRRGRRRPWSRRRSAGRGGRARRPVEESLDRPPTSPSTPTLARPAGRAARRRAPCSPTGAGHDAGHPGRGRGPDRDAVRPQPHRRLALPGRARRATTTAWPGSPRWPPCCRSWPGVTDVLGRATPGCRHGRRPRDVRVRRSADGRFTAVDAPGAAPAGRRRRLPGLVLPGLRQRPLPRLPPGAARAHPRRRRHVLDLARADVRRRRAARPRHATSRWPAPSTPRWRWPASPRRRVPLPAPRARRRAVRRPERDGRGAERRRPREAGIRLTLLDTCYLAGGLGRPATAAEPASSGSPTATPTPGPSGSGACARRRRRAVGAASHSVRAVPRDALPTVAGDRRAAGPLHVHLSEQPAENDACLAHYGLHPDRAARRRRACSARRPPPCTPPTSPRRHRRCSAAPGPPSASARPPNATSPTASARPGGSRDAGARSRLGSDQHAVIDLFEEARALEMHERLRAGERGRFSPAELLDRAHRATPASAGPTPAGSRRARRADLVAVRLDTVRTAGARPGAACCSPPPRPTSTPWSSTAGTSCRDGQHVLGDVGALLARATADRRGRVT